MAAAQDRLTRIGAASTDVLWEMDAGGALTYLSPAAVGLFGEPAEALVGFADELGSTVAEASGPPVRSPPARLRTMCKGLCGRHIQRCPVAAVLGSR